MQNQPLSEPMPSHDKNILRLVARLLSALDPDGESITPEDRQLIADVLHYGTFAQISAVRDIPIQTLSYRYCRVLNRLEEAIDDAGLNTASNHRLSVLEAKLADTERLLKESQEECASLKEQLNSNTSHRLTAADKRLAKLQEECDSLKEQLSRRTSHRLAEIKGTGRVICSRAAIMDLCPLDFFKEADASRMSLLLFIAHKYYYLNVKEQLLIKFCAELPISASKSPGSAVHLPVWSS